MAPGLTGATERTKKLEYFLIISRYLNLVVIAEDNFIANVATLQ